MASLDKIQVDGTSYSIDAKTLEGVGASSFVKKNELDSLGYITKEELNSLGFIKKSDIFPVGSIYISLNSTNPSSIFGGTWEQIQGRFLLGVSSSHPVNQTGGEEKHTLTVKEIPSHSHRFKDSSHTFSWGRTVTNNVYLQNAIAVGGNTPSNNAMTSQANWDSTNSSGGSKAHNNMPPYLAVYMWKRTA